MRYFIKHLKTKKSDPKWKVQLISYKQEDIQKLAKPNHKAKKVTKDIKKDKWHEHGFQTSMTYEEAVERKNQLNAQTKLDEERRARAVIQQRFDDEDKIECAFLPPLLVIEFEKKLERDSYCDPKEFKRSKIISHWRAIKRLIREIAIDPKHWEDEKRRIYNYFIKQEWSVSYSEKIIIILNKWGHFCAKKQNIFYAPIPFPRSKDKYKIDDAYRNSDKTTKESSPLKLNDLAKAKDRLPVAQYNWLMVSLWFGLRPSEVDSLKSEEGKAWRIEAHKGTIVLAVYQSKLVGLNYDKRWKLIPCIFEEQREAIKIIQSQELQRPLVKVIKKHLNTKLTTYGGRKGFESLLLEQGIEFNVISAYLGHQSVDRTWKNYRDRETVVLPEEFKGNQKLLKFNKQIKVKKKVS